MLVLNLEEGNSKLRSGGCGTCLPGCVKVVLKGLGFRA